MEYMEYMEYIGYMEHMEYMVYMVYMGYMVFENQIYGLPKSHPTTGVYTLVYVFFTNGVHMRAMEVSRPPSGAEFRSASF